MIGLSGNGYRGPALWVAYGIILILWLVGSWFLTGSVFTSRSNALISEKSQLIQMRIDNVAEAFAHNLAEVHGIPALVANNDEVLRALSHYNVETFPSSFSVTQRQAKLRGSRQLASVNTYLKLIDELLGSDVLYIMNLQGIA